MVLIVSCAANFEPVEGAAGGGLEGKQPSNSGKIGQSSLLPLSRLAFFLCSYFESRKK